MRRQERCYSRVIGCQQEVEQQAYGLLHADLVGGGHALVQLVENGGQYHLEAGHREVSAEVHGVDAILSESLDDIPDVYQVHWGPSGRAQWKRGKCQRRGLQAEGSAGERFDCIHSLLHFFCTNLSLQAVL